MIKKSWTHTRHTTVHGCSMTDHWRVGGDLWTKSAEFFSVCSVKSFSNIGNWSVGFIYVLFFGVLINDIKL
jgi:hypothetical protein